MSMNGLLQEIHPALLERLRNDADLRGHFVTQGTMAGLGGLSGLAGRCGG